MVSIKLKAFCTSCGSLYENNGKVYSKIVYNKQKLHGWTGNQTQRFCSPTVHKFLVNSRSCKAIVKQHFHIFSSNLTLTKIFLIEFPWLALILLNIASTVATGAVQTYSNSRLKFSRLFANIESVLAERIKASFYYDPDRVIWVQPSPLSRCCVLG